MLRVGAVSYLNAKPLYYRLGEKRDDVQLSIDLPSRLAEQLARGDLDLALIPSIEYLRGSALGLGYEILPGFAIAANGPVRSVKLFSRVPFARIERLALDEGSRTSQVLARVWLDAAYGVRPARVELLPMGISVHESMADAVLLIGDRAMQVDESPFHAVVDLADAWKSLTGLPFVFALWVARAEVDLGSLPETLARCRSEGLEHAADLARIHGRRLGLELETCLNYLTNVLSYHLGEFEVAGLTRFAHMAAHLGLAPEGVDLVFHDRRLDLAASG